MKWLNGRGRQERYSETVNLLKSICSLYLLVADEVQQLRGQEADDRVELFCSNSARSERVPISQHRGTPR